MKRALAIAIAAGAFVHAASAQTLLYSNDFETAVAGPEWSSNTIFTWHSNFTTFVGRYTGNQGVTLTLDTPPDPGCGGGGGGTPGGSRGCFNQFALTFDLYIIDSWDGNDTQYGPDHFQILINDVMVFDETFSNQSFSQSFRPPDIGPMHMGFNSLWKDSIYRDINIDFTIAEASEIQIRFQGYGLQSLNDESWGIDNVRVSYTAVPAPGTLGLLAAGALAMARRRRP